MEDDDVMDGQSLLAFISCWHRLSQYQSICPYREGPRGKPRSLCRFECYYLYMVFRASFPQTSTALIDPLLAKNIVSLAVFAGLGLHHRCHDILLVLRHAALPSIAPSISFCRGTGVSIASDPLRQTEGTVLEVWLVQNGPNNLSTAIRACWSFTSSEKD